MSEPRLTPVPVERWDEESRALLLGHLRRPELYLSGAPDAPPMPKVLGLLAHHLRLGHAWLSFNDVLVKHAVVDQRLRELIVLRVAWRTRSEYEWVQHARIGKHAGLSVEQLRAVPQGADADVWTPLESAVLAATDQVIDRHRVDDATWARLCEHFDAQQLLELLFTAGAYICFAAVANSAGLQPDPPTEPIDVPSLPRSQD